MTLNAWRDALGVLNLVASALLLVRLISARLLRSYPFLALYFAADILETGIGLIFPFNTSRYLYFYTVGQSLMLILGMLLMVEMYRLALEGRAALARFTQKAAGQVLLALTAFALLGLYFGPTVPPGRVPSLHYFLTFERTMDSILALALALLTVFLAWFPVQIRRNVAINIGAFAAYYLAHWAATFAANQWHASTRLINVGLLSFCLVCFSAWIWQLRREGEAELVVTGHRWNELEMERLAGQLDAINNRIMRSY